MCDAVIFASGHRKRFVVCFEFSYEGVIYYEKVHNNM